MQPEKPASTKSSAEDLARQAWRKSFEELDTDPNALALAGRVNLRINALEAFKAVYHTAKVYLKVHTIAAGAATPWEFVELGKDCVHAVMSALDAFRETMTDLEYAACVVLSAHEDGLPPAEFERALKEFLSGAQWEKLPWYMGFTETYVRGARDALAEDDSFEAVIVSLSKKKWLRKQGDKLSFVERHYTWGLSRD